MSNTETRFRPLIDGGFSRTEIETARTDDRPHPVGRSYAAGTYRRHGCRCARCTKAVSDETTAYKRRHGLLPPERVRTLTPLVSKIRNTERARRTSLARFRALRALADRHFDEYRDLLRIAHCEIRNTDGPLPGDPT